MEKDVKELLDYLTDEKTEGSTLWGMEDEIADPTDEASKAAMEKLFTPEQLIFIHQLLKNVISALKFHDSKDSSPHEDLTNQIENIDAKLRNHRHDLNKQYSAKPEF